MIEMYKKELNNKGFKCPFCDERFQTKDELQTHLQENLKCKLTASMKIVDMDFNNRLDMFCLGIREKEKIRNILSFMDWTKKNKGLKIKFAEKI